MVIDCAHYTAILWFEIKIFAHLKGFIIIYKWVFLMSFYI